jgi:UTRA domain
MPKTVEGEEYLSTQEVRDTFDKASKKRFYDNIKPYLRVYHFDGRRLPWYSKKEVLALKNGKPLRKGTIPITGMFSNWTEYARSLGFNVQTISREATVGPLPQELAEMFRVSTDEQFVRRGRMSWVEGLPICSWDSYYPVSLVSDILPQIQDGTAHDIVEYIADRHGFTVGEVTDVYSSRLTTFTEQTLFQLLQDEPLLILQRMAKTADQQVVVLFSDMQLLSSWFVIQRTEKIHHWDK